MRTFFTPRKHQQFPKLEPVCGTHADIQKMRDLHIQRVGNVHNLDWYRRETQPRNS
jgi:hypothetical protein